MNIHSLLSTEEREKSLGYFLEHPSQKINMNGIARELGMSPGQVFKYVNILKKEGLLSASGLRETPLTLALRALWNLKRIQKARAVEILRKHFAKAKGIGVFGSWAAGTNAENSDLDVWVKLDEEPNELRVARARKEMELKINVPIDLVIATPEKLKHFREKSDAFYFSLYNARVLWGESI